MKCGHEINVFAFRCGGLSRTEKVCRRRRRKHRGNQARLVSHLPAAAAAAVAWRLRANDFRRMMTQSKHPC